MEESVVCLIFCTDVGFNLAFGECRLRMQDYYTCHSIGTVHKGGWAFYYLDAVHAAAVDFHTVFVAPLLPFLAYTFAHDYDAVVAKSAYNWFGDDATGSQLADSRLVGNGVDDVCR